MLRLGHVPAYEGLTLHQIAVWEYVRLLANGRGWCEFKQSEGAFDLHMDVKTFRSALGALLNSERVQGVKRRSASLLVVLPEFSGALHGEVFEGGRSEYESGNFPSMNGNMPDHNNIEDFKKGGVVDISGRLEADKEHERISYDLLQTWNGTFKETVAGANQVEDQQALIQILRERDAAFIERLMTYLDETGKIQYWPRPRNLMKHTDQGNGIYAWAWIELAIGRQKSRQKEAGGSSAWDTIMGDGK